MTLLFSILLWVRMGKRKQKTFRVVVKRVVTIVNTVVVRLIIIRRKKKKQQPRPARCYSCCWTPAWDCHSFIFYCSSAAHIAMKCNNFIQQKAWPTDDCPAILDRSSPQKNYYIQPLKYKFLTSLKREKCCRIRLINLTITQRRISIRPARPASAAAVIITQRGVRAVLFFFQLTIQFDSKWNTRKKRAERCRFND